MVAVLEETRDREEVVARVAALDISKKDVVCCVRVPAEKPGGGRRQEVATYSTMTRSLLLLADRLRELGVTRVVMEATSDYWRAPFYVLEAAGFQTWLVNAKDVKHLPGRPKTDRLDAVWLCKVAERQMLRPSFVPPPEIRELRDLTRYRSDLVAVRTAEKQRVEKLLEDAQIKLSVVASDIFGVSGRAMMQALIDGRRDPAVLAEMARGRLRPKRPELAQALTGRFAAHHAWLLSAMLARVDAAEADIAGLDARIEERMRPYAEQADALCTIPGVNSTTAAAIIAEIGVDMSRFPTPAHLASWARFAPGVKESAGRKTGGSKTGKGNRYLAGSIGLAAGNTARTSTFLGARYRRLTRRRSKNIARVAVGRSMLVVIWHLLSEPGTTYNDLGPGFYDARVNSGRATRSHVRQLEALGYTVTLQPAA